MGKTRHKRETLNTGTKMGSMNREGTGSKELNTILCEVTMKHRGFSIHNVITRETQNSCDTLGDNQ